MGDGNEEHLKLPDHTQPSDYSDVHPKSYDPDYISQISSKMQVPDRIGVGAEYYEGKENGFVHPELSAATQFVGMTVPDRIVLAVEEREDRRDRRGKSPIKRSPSVDDWYPRYPDMHIPYTLLVGGSSRSETECGDNQHLAMRQNLELDVAANSAQMASESLSYVGLITPPRTLTVQEQFPVVEETDDQKMAAQGAVVNRGQMTGNGHVGGPVPYDPGVSLHDSVLLNEENEATLLRTQVAKLTRRVQVIEQDNQKRANREVVMYPLILGYFLWKILGWLTRDR